MYGWVGAAAVAARVAVGHATLAARSRAATADGTGHPRSPVSARRRPTGHAWAERGAGRPSPRVPESKWPDGQECPARVGRRVAGAVVGEPSGHPWVLPPTGTEVRLGATPADPYVPVINEPDRTRHHRMGLDGDVR